MAKEWRVHTARRTVKTWTNCARGRKARGDPRNSQPTKRRYPVSTYSTLRNGIPELIDRNSAAADIITIFRKPVYDEDRLFKGHGRRTRAGNKEADEEYERRNETRQVYQTLSRCYHLEGNRRTWRAPQLLSKGKHLIVHYRGDPLIQLSSSPGRPRYSRRYPEKPRLPLRPQWFPGLMTYPDIYLPYIVKS